MREKDPVRRAVRYQLERLAELDGTDGTDGPDGADGADGVDGPDSADDRRAASGDPSGGTDTGGVEAPRQEPDTVAGEGRPAGAGDRPRPTSMAGRAAFADELVRQAMARGEFDDLPLAGKPIPGLTGRHDPDWWIKAFIEREQITGVLPEALQLRKDDAVLDARLDEEHLESRVRETLEEFNARVVEARRQLLGGPPVVTPTRDVEAEVLRWRERRGAHDAVASRDPEPARSGRTSARARTGRSRRWWRRS